MENMKKNNNVELAGPAMAGSSMTGIAIPKKTYGEVISVKTLISAQEVADFVAAKLGSVAKWQEMSKTLVNAIVEYDREKAGKYFTDMTGVPAELYDKVKSFVLMVELPKFKVVTVENNGSLAAVGGNQRIDINKVKSALGEFAPAVTAYEEIGETILAPVSIVKVLLEMVGVKREEVGLNNKTLEFFIDPTIGQVVVDVKNNQFK